MDYLELIDDHDRIDQLAAQVECIARGGPIHQAVLRDIIHQLAIVVQEHLEKEDSFIYPELAKSSDPADAESLIIEFREIKRDWIAYLRAWGDGASAGEWKTFQKSTLGMLDRLRKRVMKETGLLYGMALRLELIAMHPTDANPR
jgi:hypothetical protein